jgi:hypothetical protein
MIATIESLKQQAIEKTGLSDFGPPTYVEPLQAWLADLASPVPNERGVQFYTRLAVNDLCRRLDIIDWLNRHPEIADVPVPPILYITGHERSGTTLLHNLLSLDARARSLKRWELMRPTPPPDTASYSTDLRIAEVQAPLERLRGTLLEHMHWVDADDPEECTWGLWNGTGMLGQSPSTVLPNWREWLSTADLTDTFSEYRQLIQLLLWRNPVGEEGYLVLKSPQHAISVDVLARIFPEAHFVFTHRDPFRAFTSLCVLAGHTNESFINDARFLQADGRGVEPLIRRSEIKLTRLVGSDKALGHRITNVAYPELVDTPRQVVQSVYKQAGYRAPDNLNEAISAFMARQKAGHRARPPGELSTLGLDHLAFLRRKPIARYCAHFGVAVEQTRATG